MALALQHARADMRGAGETRLSGHWIDKTPHFDTAAVSRSKPWGEPAKAVSGQVAASDRQEPDRQETATGFNKLSSSVSFRSVRSEREML